MKTTFISVIVFLFVLAFGFSFSACSGGSASGFSANNSSAVQTADCENSPCPADDNSVIDNKSGEQYICQNPVIAAVAVDQSGSMKWSGTAATTADDLRPLLEHIAVCGGSNGVTFVRSDSAKPIERFRAAEPSPFPIKPIQKADEEDYEFADRLDEYDLAVSERVKTVRKDQAQLQPKIDDYLKTLTPLLAQKPSGATDFSGAVNRLFVYLEEGDAAWHVKPHRYLIIVSDSADTVGKAKNSFNADATVFWVNATASDKSMKDLPYQRFESFQAAAAEVLAREGVK